MAETHWKIPATGNKCQNLRYAKIAEDVKEVERQRMGELKKRKR